MSTNTTSYWEIEARRLEARCNYLSKYSIHWRCGQLLKWLLFMLAIGLSVAVGLFTGILATAILCKYGTSCGEGVEAIGGMLGTCSLAATFIGSYITIEGKWS